MAGPLQRGRKGRQRGDERQRAIRERFRAEPAVPLGCTFILGRDDHQHPADLLRHAQAAQGGGKQKLAPKSSARHRLVDGEPCQEKAWHLVTRQTLRHRLRHDAMCDGSGRNAVEAEDPVRRIVCDGAERLGGILLVPLTGKGSFAGGGEILR